MHEKYMREAYKEALKAKGKDEVPVGAVVVYQDVVIARAHNQRNTKQLASAHAEMLAIEKACKKRGSWRLEDCILYVTLEPCPMCSGGIIQSRIPTVVFGAYDPKGGCFGSLLDFREVQGFNHYPDVVGGVLKEECGQILTDFFKEKRKKK